MIPNVFLLGRLRRPKRIAKKRLIRAFERRLEEINADHQKKKRILAGLREHMAPIPVEEVRETRFPYVQKENENG